MGFIEDQIIDDFDLACRTPSDINEHLPTLHQLAMDAATHILELGVRSGNSTVALLAGIIRTRRDILLTSLDIEKPSDPVAKYVGKVNYWEFIQSNTLTWEPPKFKFDLIFLDTSHEYIDTVSELKKYTECLEKRGVFALHDSQSCWPTVGRAIHEFLNANPGWNFREHKNNNGLFVMWRS